ncbi:triose-phosphate isomerase [Sporosarcina sp. Marseille-Q4063]|uniref:triose-phosphate isomerase n=1 Tax=Sporosarcina sp. Marseille-Q4063 TaxID=2810514 RepID=UPI001BAEEB03|nr:triose-phosphate isomerase [Sporosarcina sp. Marseille-Q4063]QUW23326.1 triose-phosphate isomerase [Sporosarcina sp. Marseille-Q4063]
MRKRIIAGNWKMYKTAEEAEQFAEEVKAKLPVSDRVEAIVCTPSLYLTKLVDLTEGSALNIGAQTMHSEKEGAFTGEVSPAMLKSVGVNYVILGHSERREYYNETDQSVNEKVHAAFEYDLTPIVCVGETLDERESNTTVEKVSHQVKEAFKAVDGNNAKKAVIAYEPIWAIGTGKTATADDANEVCEAIRKTVEELYSEEVSDAVRIQYGGSVNPNNIEELLSKEHIDGALVGGASLEPESFIKLIEAGANE